MHTPEMPEGFVVFNLDYMYPTETLSPLQIRLSKDHGFSEISKWRDEGILIVSGAV